MQIVTISDRLRMIAQKVPSGATLADIGSDHALLPVYLTQKGLVSAAIAGELNDGPYASASGQVQSLGLTKLIDVRQGDGLDVLKLGEASSVVIAGMGGGLIGSILEQGKEKLKTVDRLILQPNIGEKIVRTWLVKHGWVIVDEELLQEDGLFYEIIVADRQHTTISQNQAVFEAYEDECGLTITKTLQMEMGPLLLRKREPLLVDKWTYELGKLHRMMDQMKRSSSATALHKRQQLASLCSQIEEVLLCLQKDKRSFNYSKN